MPNELTTAESNQLARHERTIKSTKGAFVACGKALEAIRDSRLYRVKYSTFQEYCQDRWGWGKRRANQIIEGAQTVAALPDKVGTQVPTEKAARALKKVPKGKRAKVIKEAAAKGGVTPKNIADAAKQLTNGEAVLDEMGYIVPKRTLPFWIRKWEAKQVLVFISDARCAVRNLVADDPMWVESHINGVLSKLNEAYNLFATSVPYAVCPQCQGQLLKDCTLCGERGVISKFKWDNAIAKEIKDLRAKAIAAQK